MAQPLSPLVFVRQAVCEPLDFAGKFEPAALGIALAGEGIDDRTRGHPRRAFGGGFGLWI